MFSDVSCEGKSELSSISVLHTQSHKSYFSLGLAFKEQQWLRLWPFFGAGAERLPRPRMIVKESRRRRNVIPGGSVWLASVHESEERGEGGGDAEEYHLTHDLTSHMVVLSDRSWCQGESPCLVSGTQGSERQCCQREAQHVGWRKGGWGGGNERKEKNPSSIATEASTPRPATTSHMASLMWFSEAKRRKWRNDQSFGEGCRWHAWWWWWENKAE